MSFLSNGGKFKLYTVLNGWLFLFFSFNIWIFTYSEENSLQEGSKKICSVI
jgi:hypothetical protein